MKRRISFSIFLSIICTWDNKIQFFLLKKDFKKIIPITDKRSLVYISFGNIGLQGLTLKML